MSKKIKFLAALFCGIFCLVFLVGNAIKAETGPVISNISAGVTLNSAYIIWHTDVSSTAKVEYGKTSGQYTDSYEVSDSKTQFGVNIGSLDYEVTYYYRITAKDLQGNSSNSDEYSFTTSTRELKIETLTPRSIGSNKVSVYVKINKIANCTPLKYGTSADSLTNDAKRNTLIGGSGGSYVYHFTLTGLQSETNYYYQLTCSRYESWHSADEDEKVTSEIKSVTTTGQALVENISPESGPVGTILTINGKNFGNEIDTDYLRRYVNIGSEYNIYKADTSHWAEIISWSDAKIVVKVNNKSVTGPIYIGKEVTDGIEENIFTIKGPTFTVTSGTAPTPSVAYVGEAYGCKYSTTTKNKNTVQVNTLFTEGSNTDKYFSDVYNAYYNAWSRYPRCDELQFHYSHSTPLETLNNWLAEYSITEKYGCKYSTSVSDENTVKLGSLFILDSETDKHLNSVYEAYYETWGRYPRCDELEFHATHNTSLSRLNSWLLENKPDEEVSGTSAMKVSDLEGNNVVFRDSGSDVILKSTSQDLSFESDERITFSGITDADSIVVLMVASETVVYTTSSDSEGNWAYTLPGPLEAGEHSVKVSVLDENGDTIRESDELSFTVGTIAEVKSKSTSSELSTRDKVIIFVAIIVALVLIAIFVSIKKKKRI